jgi:hypothetical protein
VKTSLSDRGAGVGDPIQLCQDERPLRRRKLRDCQGLPLLQNLLLRRRKPMVETQQKTRFFQSARGVQKVG